VSYFYASPNIILLIKSSRTRLAGHRACMGEMRYIYNILVGKPERKRPLGRLGIEWKISELILGKQGGKVWTGCI
jgi:hypothetical protein